MMPEVTPANDDSKRRLAIELLRCTGHIVLGGRGTSMLPIIWPGDVLTIERANGNFVLGDIVLIERDDRLFVHRLIKFSEDGQQWTARGDALLQPDPPVGQSQILGRVAAIRGRNSSNAPVPQLSFLHRAVGLALGYSEHLRSLVLRVHHSKRSFVSSARVEPQTNGMPVSS